MRKHLFVVLISFVLLVLTDLIQAVNLTYVPNEHSWYDAVMFCKNNGSTLESNITEINSQPNYDQGTEVWLGTYTEVTNWTYIKGCYYLEQLSYYNVEMENLLECQKLCQTQAFYSIKNEKCYCFNDDPSKYTRCQCDDQSCFKVWKHKLQIYDDEENLDFANRCIVAKNCISGVLDLGYSKCEEGHYAICDDGSDLNYTTGSYYAAAGACQNRGSFLKWYSLPCSFLNEHMTSGKRSEWEFDVKPHRNIYIEMVLKCLSSSSPTECNRMFPFYCRHDEDIQTPEKVIVPQSINTDDPSLEFNVVALGVVLAVISALAIAVILLLLFAKRRNIKLPCVKHHTVVSSNNKTLKHDMDNKSVPTVTSCNSNIGNHENNTFAKPFVNDKEEKTNDYLANPIKEKSDDLSNNENYSLAKETFEIDDYAFNTDYDHLNKVVKNVAESNYSFTPGGEPKTTDEYDVMQSIRNNRKSCNETEYDHFTSRTNCDDPAYVTAKHTDKNKECDDYDHFTTK